MYREQGGGEEKNELQFIVIWTLSLSSTLTLPINKERIRLDERKSVTMNWGASCMPGSPKKLF